MERKEAEARIRDLAVEIGKISREYGTHSYLTVTLFTKDGYLHFNNDMCEKGDDVGCPLNHSEFGIDFGEEGVCTTSDTCTTGGRG